MLVSDSDDLAVVRGDLVEVRDPLEERRSVRRCRAGAVLSQRQDRDRLPGRSKDVNALVAALQRQPDARMPGDAPASGQHQPRRPLRVTRAWRTVRAVRDLVDAAAPVAAPVRVAMPRMVGRELLRARPGVLLVGLRLVPPAELRKIKSVIVAQPALLHRTRPGLETLWKVKLGHTPPGEIGWPVVMKPEGDLSRDGRYRGRTSCDTSCTSERSY